ncbi:MAG TPA: hypothetical protein H9736_03540 [Candidatus Anaerotruncus excrementipullorum]|uniref:Uncharacterized protein n=1 Tax=Candidatus Anaerotruncus excrementipullorum TaxID=2838465 RepID=A0A9D1WSM5_9FIRM|nr:hypothetical protein [Candidatus Anaerotruncus excrementipullorum]
MFGLSKQELLVKTIKNACINELPQYDTAIKDFLNSANDPNISDETINKLYLDARRNYFDAVCCHILNSFSISSPNIYARFKLAMMNPQMTGLPSEFSSDYLSSNGISAGAVFAFAYFALTNKKVDTKLFRTMSMLNHYQVDLMNNTLQKYDK